MVTSSDREEPGRKFNSPSLPVRGCSIFSAQSSQILAVRKMARFAEVLTFMWAVQLALEDCEQSVEVRKLTQFVRV